MGKRGPKRKPPDPNNPTWREIAADKAGDKAVSIDGAPEKPAGLSGDAAVIWDQLLPLLLDMRVVDRANATALALLCETQATFDSYSGYLAWLRGKTPANSDRLRWYEKLDSMPLDKVIKARDLEHANLRRMQAAFGISPADRGTITVTKSAKKPDTNKTNKPTFGTQLTG